MCGWSPFHKWSNWEVAERGPVTSRSPSTGKPLLRGETIVQERKCKRCKKLQVETQHIDLV